MNLSTATDTLRYTGYGMDLSLGHDHLRGVPAVMCI